MPAPHPGETRERAAALVAEGLTYAEVGRRVGVDGSTICRWFQVEQGPRLNKPVQCDLCREVMVRDEAHNLSCLKCGSKRNRWNQLSRKQRDEYRTRNRNFYRVRREEIKRAILEAKDGPCMDCGERHAPYVMEFDHVRGVKEFGIAQALAKANTLERLEREIAKCDLVCANCHRTRHYADGIWRGTLMAESAHG